MDVDIAAAATLFADPTRAAVIAALLDGRALTAGELARTAEVSAATASSHLHRLLDAGYVAVSAQGRHRYYALSDERVGRAFESLAALAPTRPIRSLRQSKGAERLRYARTCYDHLAGASAVALADSLVDNGDLRSAGDAFELTDAGVRRLTEFGLDVATLARARRSFAHPCLDWSERRHHIGGALGAALLDRMLDLGWLTRDPQTRAVRLQSPARDGFSTYFSCELPAR